MTAHVWVTGAAGFTGRHLIDCLREKYPAYSIIGLGRAEPSQHGCDIWIDLDITQTEQLISAAKQYPPVWVFHLAAVMPPANEVDMWHTNLAGTHSLLSALYSSGNSRTRVLCVGSAAEYTHKDTGCYSESDPVIGFTPYGKVKSAQTLLALKMGEAMNCDVLVARPFNLVGPGLSENLIAGKLCRDIKQSDGRITLGNVHSERDFLDIRDAVRAYCLILEHGQAQQSYNVCTGVPVKIKDLVETAAAVLGVTLKLSIDESLFRSKDLDRVFGENKRLCQTTGWQPQISLKQSLIDMLSV